MFSLTSISNIATPGFSNGVQFIKEEHTRSSTASLQKKQIIPQSIKHTVPQFNIRIRLRHGTIVTELLDPKSCPMNSSASVLSTCTYFVQEFYKLHRDNEILPVEDVYEFIIHYLKPSQ